MDGADPRHDTMDAPDAPLADILESRARRYAQVQEVERAVVTQAVVFTRGTGRYAAALHELKEIRELDNWCPIPGASPIVPGVVHYRGELLSLHDLSAFTRGEPCDRPAEWVVILESRQRLLGLMADAMLDVATVEEGDVKPVPITLGAVGECLRGLVHEGTLLLDVPRLFDTPRFYDAF